MSPSDLLRTNLECSQQLEELKSRLRKPENLLAPKNSSDLLALPSTNLSLNPASVPVRRGYFPPKAFTSANFRSVDIKAQDFPDTELGKTVTWIETDAFEHEPSLSHVCLRHACSDDWGNMLNPLAKATLASRTKIAEGFGSFLYALTRPSTPTSLDVHNIITALPSRSQGESLLKFFFDEILWIYHILHLPTVITYFDKLYADIETQQRPEYGPLALISTLYALTAYFSSKSSGLFFRYSESMSYCHKWTFLYVCDVLFQDLL